MAAHSAAQPAVQSFSASVVLPQRTTVGFTVRDDHAPAHDGGLSVRVSAVSPVPEPAVAWLLLVGLGGVGRLARRQARAAMG